MCSGGSCLFTPSRPACLEETDRTQTWMSILQVEAGARWITAALNVELANGKTSCSLEGNDGCFQFRSTCHMSAAAACRQLSKTAEGWLLSNWLQLQVTQEVYQAVHVFSHPPCREAWKRLTGLRLSLYARRREVCSVQASCQVSKTTVA